jgi:hypothetical protein
MGSKWPKKRKSSLFLGIRYLVTENAQNGPLFKAAIAAGVKVMEISVEKLLDLQREVISSIDNPEAMKQLQSKPEFRAYANLQSRVYNSTMPFPTRLTNWAKSNTVAAWFIFGLEGLACVAGGIAGVKGAVRLYHWIFG